MTTQNGGYLRRLFAYLLDINIFWIILLLPIVVIVMTMPNSYSFLDIGAVSISYALSTVMLSGILGTVYHTYFVSKLGGTPGKLAFGLKVVDYETDQKIDTKRAFFRTIIGYPFSTQIFGLGYLRIIKHPEKRGWHDELFETKVVKTKGPWLGVIMLVIAFITINVIIFSVVGTITQNIQIDNGPKYQDNPAMRLTK